MSVKILYINTLVLRYVAGQGLSVKVCSPISIAIFND